VTYLSERLSPAPHVPKEKIQPLIADLDSNEFAKRDQATKGLVRLQEAAEAPLLEVLKGDPPLELRRRVEAILLNLHAARMKPPPLPPGEELRAVRAVEVLERIGTPEARGLLARLAKGAPYVLLTREAQASLGRVGRRD
jgi:HEAT repeat protein